MASEFTSTFLRDADELLEVLKSDNPAGSVEGRIELARALHSLKSGASFLGWDDLENHAHSLEDLLISDAGVDYNWLEAAANLAGLINPRRSSSESVSRQKKKVGRIIRFTGLERRVLQESRQRGEKFYRLTCEIDPTEPLPYPRAYLLASRLETGMTLVKSEPPMDNPEGDFGRTVFWFTTDESETEVHRTTNIDQVSVTELITLDYDDLLSKEGVSADEVFRKAESEDSTLMVDRTRYAEAIEIAEELAWRLEDRPGRVEASLSSELQRTLETLAFRPLEPMLSEIEEGVSRLSRRRGIKARFQWSLGSGGLDASTMDSLGEVIRQLVRNSLRHGIETPEERMVSGKALQGELSLRMERSGRSYRFTYEDDGRGIDEEAVLESTRRDFPDSSSTDLLEILCVRGFSTAVDADPDGGRGMGLDMIRHILSREFESHLEMENLPGRGLVFHWSLPDKHMRRPYLVFVSDGRSWAIPADSVIRRGVMDPEKVNATGQAYDIGGGLIPLVGPLGLRPPGTVMPYVLEIKHRGRRAALLVDDLLSEEPWGSDELVPADPAGPWCRSLKDAKEGIPILSPAIVYAAESGGARDTN